MSDFKNLRNSIILSSFGAASVGVFLWFTPAKPLANWVVAASVGGLIAAELITEKAEISCKNQIGIFETEVNKLTFNLEAERGLVFRQKQELANQAVVSQKLAEELQQLKFVVSTLREQLKNYQSQIESLQTANGEAATEIMQDSFQEFQTQLNALIASLAKRYPNLPKDWEALRHELDSYMRLFAARVNTVISQTNAKDLIEMSLAMQHEIISTGATLKVKAYKAIVTYLTREFDGVVFREEHETLLEQLNAAWQAKNQAIALTYNKNFEAIKQEFGQIAENVTTGYREDFKSIVDEGLTQVEQIEELQKNILWLQGRLEESSKSHQFPTLVEQARVGNAIIDYYYRTSICLDAIDWDDTENGYKLMFHVGRNGSRFISTDMLNANDAPQKLKEVSGAINTPEFKHNTRGGHVFLEIQTRHPKKKDNSKDEIDKLWIPASRFEKVVKSWERIRITAGSTGGKSPTAKNLALAILKSRKGVGEIRLYDPQHGSKKDFWNMPKAGKSHKDNLIGMKELCDLIDERRHGKNYKFMLYIFDEVDTTIAKSDAKREFADLVNSSLKEASHADIGVIYIGQSVDANEIPGMTWSDWGNAVQLHIGSNAFIWLDKAKTLTNEDANKLKEQYKKIQEYCDRQNQELGLDVFTDAGAFRFALAVPLTGLPKFIQLPDFDTYDYEEVMSINAHTNLFVDKNYSAPIEVNKQILDIKIVCPKCGSENYKRNGKAGVINPIQRYLCKDCGYSFKELDWTN
jgi:predicted RNA-binding Zn-ribbon protein involved in translation (DUF1610 family)